MIAACSAAGGYAWDGEFLREFNVIELICSDAGEPAWYEALAGRIAKHLGWAASEDHEQRQIWPFAFDAASGKTVVEKPPPRRVHAGGK